MKARSFRKVTDVSEVEASDEDGHLIRNMTIKANSKIVKERIWINLVINETTFQSLEQDTDAHLHEERVISVRKEAEFAHQVLPARCPRWNADTLETSR